MAIYPQVLAALAAAAAFALPKVAAVPWNGAAPTVVDTPYDLSTGWTPRPTTPPAVYRAAAHDLFKRDLFISSNTCGFLSGSSINPWTVDVGATCYFNTDLSVVGQEGAFYTACLPSSILASFSCDSVCFASTRLCSGTDYPFCLAATYENGFSQWECAQVNEVNTLSVSLTYSGQQSIAAFPIFTGAGGASTGKVTPAGYQAKTTSSSHAASSSSSSSKTSTSSSQPTQTGKSGSSTPVGAIVGGVVGGIAVIGIIALVLICLFCRGRRNRNNPPPQPQPVPQQQQPPMGYPQSGAYQQQAVLPQGYGQEPKYYPNNTAASPVDPRLSGMYNTNPHAGQHLSMGSTYSQGAAPAPYQNIAQSPVHEMPGNDPYHR